MPISKLKQYWFWNTQVLPISLAQQMKNNIKIEFDALFFVYSEHIISSQLWFSKKKKKKFTTMQNQIILHFFHNRRKEKKENNEIIIFYSSLSFSYSFLSVFH